MVNLQCRRIQVDEIWAFNYCKQKAVEGAKRAPQAAGDIWTWVAMDPDTKLVPSWFVGGRDMEHAQAFIGDLKDRLANRVQLTSDGHRPYLSAVPENFRGQIDYAVLVKHYAAPKPEAEAARRYSPTECTGVTKDVVWGKPDPKHICTSHVERQNLTMRMGMRRFTRLTNGFSKKAQNHVWAVSLHFMHYNFCRIHKSLRVTPAMAAGVSNKLWEITDLVRTLEEWEIGRRPKFAGTWSNRAACLSSASFSFSARRTAYTTAAWHYKKDLRGRRSACRPNLDWPRIVDLTEWRIGCVELARHLLSRTAIGRQSRCLHRQSRAAHRYR